MPLNTEFIVVFYEICNESRTKSSYFEDFFTGDCVIIKVITIFQFHALEFKFKIILVDIFRPVNTKFVTVLDRYMDESWADSTISAYQG